MECMICNRSMREQKQIGKMEQSACSVCSVVKMMLLREFLPNIPHSITTGEDC